MMCRYLGAWNVFAVDLKNEPHDSATWGDNNMRTDWRLAAERLGNMILASSLNSAYIPHFSAEFRSCPHLSAVFHIIPHISAEFHITPQISAVQYCNSQYSAVFKFCHQFS